MHYNFVKHGEISNPMLAPVLASLVKTRLKVARGSSFEPNDETVRVIPVFQIDTIRYDTIRYDTIRLRFTFTFTIRFTEIRHFIGRRSYVIPK